MLIMYTAFLNCDTCEHGSTHDSTASGLAKINTPVYVLLTCLKPSLLIVALTLPVAVYMLCSLPNVFPS